MTDPASELSQIAGEIRRCKKCPLWKTRINAVPGDGVVSAEAIIVGEAPGRTEDLHGQPFVGSAGRNLDVFLGEAGLDRKRAFITNTVKCRPPSNRRPNKKELETCYQYLRRQIELISPKIVVLLGEVAVREFFPDSSLSTVHGRLLKRGGISYFPTYHPAAVIYNPSLKQTIIDDFRGLGRELGRGDGAV